ncbi:MAG: RNA polymerase sigma factor [Salibacteraceae bacterium]
MDIHPELIKRCLKNERRAHHELYRKCYGFMMAICLRYMSNKSEAESLLNQAFLKVVTHLGKYNPDIPFGSWVNRVTINTIIDQYRREKKHREHIVEPDVADLRSNHPVYFNLASEQFDAEQLEAMIQALPETSRKVFNLYAIEGYTHKEIGEMLGMSDGTSKWHVSFARKKLQEMIALAMENLKTTVL